MIHRLQAINRKLLLALVITFAYHGGLVFYTFRRTYDAFVHIFFADHYARAWFDHWEYRWYTGFTMTSYPPGSQQSVALLSRWIGLENGFIVVQTFAMMMVVIGIYRFSRIWVSDKAAGNAALLAVFASSLSETIHVFGQLPTTFSLGFLLNALPFVMGWLETGRWRTLGMAWAVTAATTAGHHVTTLFGAVFFIAPVMGTAIVEAFRTPLPGEPEYHPSTVTKGNLRPLLIRRIRRMLPAVWRCFVYGVGLIVILLMVVLPYWLWSRSDPIAQVSIPHASRDSFIANPAAGLVFWLVPYGVGLVLLPYVFYKGLTTRGWILTLSMILMFVLGTGGTTPIPKLLLGGAFDILTLDRFTFWTTILMLPYLGEFVVSITEGRFARYLKEQFGALTWRTVQVGLVVAYVLTSVLVVNLTQFRRFQPAPIDMSPIVTFLGKDQHWRWRYLTLGFGDQVAWLGAQTTATSVDGNYHSARRLPELTTTPVERLEGAKFRGIPGIGSLQQFLAVPDKYNLKFVFSNDQFYDPLLYFSGWHRVQRLENGIMVWEREDIPPLPEVLPRKEIPIYQRAMWGLLPMSALVTALSLMALNLAGLRIDTLVRYVETRRVSRWTKRFVAGWISRGDAWLLARGDLPATDETAVVRWQVWLDWFQRLPRPQPAPPSAQQVRFVILMVLALGSAGSAVWWYVDQARSPTHILEAYYDDLDFRRFEDAYARLDPETRPDFETYLLELSVQGGLLASYAKLDSMYVDIVAEEPAFVRADVRTEFITALTRYDDVKRHELILRDDIWYILPDSPPDISTPPDQFFRRGAVAWKQQERRRVTVTTTSFNDVLDRPELKILSARLIELDGRVSLVGELINTDSDPGDVTVAAFLFDDQGETLTWYNAQNVIMHKLFPKEVTPFRVDFEGVAGAALGDEEPSAEFDPEAFYKIDLAKPIDTFEVYAKAVVTSRDLYRDLAVQNLVSDTSSDGEMLLTGELFNTGTLEATIPHILVTLYDDNNQVAWVAHHYLDVAVRSQRTQPFAMSIPPRSELTILVDKGDLYANILENDELAEWGDDPNWIERIPLPAETGYSAMRISVHYYVATP